MTIRSLFLSGLAATVAILGAGCEVQTDSQPPLSYPPAGHVVINEVYTLPPSLPNSHSWLELFNPTSSVVNMRDWSISYKTTRVRIVTFLYYSLVIDSTRTPIWSIVQSSVESRFFVDSVATYDVPIVRAADSIQATVYRISGPPLSIMVPDTVSTPLLLAPNQFYTLVSDLDRLRVYNTIGPGDGPEPRSTPVLPTQNAFYRAAVLERDSAHAQVDVPDTIYGYQYSFFLSKDDQIVLKDGSGKAVDVVRYGTYAWTGPGADPYPTYKSVGTVPNFESIARYAGAYDSRNTAADFYITHDGLRPIPHWLSQLYKK